jgi:site-specific recombinase
MVAHIRVPELGAFLIHKGAVFRRRGDIAKMAKDLHYIVDVMQSGDALAESVAAQIAQYCAEQAVAAEVARSARNQVGLVVRESPATELRVSLATGIAERHSLSQIEGDARAVGYLTDFLELIPGDCGSF